MTTREQIKEMQARYRKLWDEELSIKKEKRVIANTIRQLERLERIEKKEIID